MKIQLLFNNQIDKIKWDNCIKNSSHPLITAESWYLDIVSPGWEALVANDYFAVMPLPKLVKGPFEFYLQPIFVQQLGIFSTNCLSVNEANQFYKKIKNRILSVSLNAHQPEPKPLKIIKGKNYILNLFKPYNELWDNFSDNCKRNIKKANRLDLKIVSELSPGEFIYFSKLNAPYKLPEKSWSKLEILISNSKKYNKGFTLEVTDRTGHIIAVAFFLSGIRRITFLSGSSSKEGINKKAMFFIINHIIQSYSNNNLILDFEGSSIENVERFYKGFGSVKEVFFKWGHNAFMVVFKMFNALKNELI